MVASREVSAVEVVEAALERDRRRQRHDQRRRHAQPAALVDDAREVDRRIGRGRIARPAVRAAGRHQGRHAGGGAAHDVRFADLRRLRAGRRRGRRSAAARVGRDHARQDQLPGVRGRRQHLQRGVRADPQSVEHREECRRVDRRRRGGTGDRHDCARRGHRPRRIAPHPGVVLRHRRPSSLDRAGADASRPTGRGTRCR